MTLQAEIGRLELKWFQRFDAPGSWLREWFNKQVHSGLGNRIREKW